jgi:hypothetical protein
MTAAPVDLFHSRAVVAMYDAAAPIAASEPTPMNYFIPYYVNDDQSDVRGVKRGWYAMDEHGMLGCGPFSTPCECLVRGAEAKHSSIPKRLH